MYPYVHVCAAAETCWVLIPVHVLLRPASRRQSPCFRRRGACWIQQTRRAPILYCTILLLQRSSLTCNSRSRLAIPGSPAHASIFVWHSRANPRQIQSIYFRFSQLGIESHGDPRENFSFTGLKCRRSYLIFHLDSNKQHFFSQVEMTLNSVFHRVRGLPHSDRISELTEKKELLWKCLAGEIQKEFVIFNNHSLFLSHTHTHCVYILTENAYIFSQKMRFEDSKMDQLTLLARECILSPPAGSAWGGVAVHCAGRFLFEDISYDSATMSRMNITFTTHAQPGSCWKRHWHMHGPPASLCRCVLFNHLRGIHKLWKVRSVLYKFPTCTSFLVIFGSRRRMSFVGSMHHSSSYCTQK